MTNNQHKCTIDVRPTTEEHENNSISNSNPMTTANIFHSMDSMGSFKHDFLELFRSTGSSATISHNNYYNSNGPTSPCGLALSAVLGGGGKAEQTRSRSSSLETQEGTEGDEVGRGGASAAEPSFDFALCAQAAASLANAGRMADNMEQQQEPDYYEEEEEADNMEQQQEPGYHEEEEEEEEENASDCADKEEQDEPELVETNTPQNGPILDSFSAKVAALDDDELRLPLPTLEELCNSDAEADWHVVPEEQKQAKVTPKKKKKRATKKRKRKIYEPAKRVYVPYTDNDVLCQRGGLANTHPGNKRFRDAKDDLQQLYFDTPKVERTQVSQQLVDKVHAWRGRFLKKDSTGWYECHNHVARTKAGQALRETYTPEDRAAKRAKYAKKKQKKPMVKRRA